MEAATATSLAAFETIDNAIDELAASAAGSSSMPPTPPSANTSQRDEPEVFKHTPSYYKTNGTYVSSYVSLVVKKGKGDEKDDKKGDRKNSRSDEKDNEKGEGVWSLA
eukprot:6635290-Heterocapsa_arctica.AAC.1